MTSRCAFNLGAALILAGLTCLLTLDSFTGFPLAAVGLSGLALLLIGVALIQRAEAPALEAHQ